MVVDYRTGADVIPRFPLASRTAAVTGARAMAGRPVGILRESWVGST
jgi:hypothetical protein